MSGFSEEEVRSALKIFNKLPERFAWKDRDLNYVLMDDQTAKMCGYASSDISFERVRDEVLPCAAAEFAEEFQKADRELLRTEEELSGMCFCSYADNQWRLLLGRQSPYRNDEGDVIGIQTIAMDVTDCVIMRSAFSLFYSDYRKIGLVNKKLSQVYYSFKNTYKDFGITSRQSEVLFFYLRGCTAKEIAQILSKRGPREICFRTVNQHIATIKLKMGCQTRAEVTEKAMESGLGTVIPKSLLTISL